MIDEDYDLFIGAYSSRLKAYIDCMRMTEDTELECLEKALQEYKKGISRLASAGFLIGPGYAPQLKKRQAEHDILAAHIELIKACKRQIEVAEEVAFEEAQIKIMHQAIGGLF